MEFAYGTGINESVIHHEHPSEFLGQRHEGLCLRGSHGHGFGYQHVPAGLEGGSTKLEMRSAGGGYHDGINLAQCQYLV